MALIRDKMRPGIVLLSVVVVFMATGIITPKQMVAGFSNRGMITVGLLFLVSEGIRQSGALTTVVKKLLPGQGGHGDAGAAAHTADSEWFLGLPQQHAGGGDIRPDTEKLGQARWPALHQVPHTAVVCHDTRRAVHAHRHLDQPRDTRHDDRPRHGGAQDVRPGIHRHTHHAGGPGLHRAHLGEAAARRAPRHV